MSSIRDRIFADVRNRHYILALETLSGFVGYGNKLDTERRGVWNEFMVGGHSLLLRAVRQWLHSGKPTRVDEARRAIAQLFGRKEFQYDPVGPLVDLQRETVWESYAGLDRVESPHAHRLWHARLAVIDAVLEPACDPFTWKRESISTRGIGKAISDEVLDLAESAVHAYADGWGIGKQQKEFGPHDAQAVAIVDGEVRREPAFFHRLPGNWVEVIKKLAHKFGRFHPGVAAVGETVAWLYAPPQPDELQERRVPAAEADKTVVTKIALASHRRHDDSNFPTGLFAELTVERIPEGYGLVYPDPISTGLRLAKPSFQEGIRNAWYAALHAVPVCNYDFRWSLKFDEPEGFVRQGWLEGRSGEVAFACALRAALNGEPLDPHVVVSARFREPQSKYFALTSVGSIDRKVLGKEHPPKEKLEKSPPAPSIPSLDELLNRWEIEGVKAILVAEDQAEVTGDGSKKHEPTYSKGGRILLDPVPDFDAAYDRLGRFARMTTAVRRGLFKRSKELLDYLCNPYCPNPMYVRLSPSEQKGAGGPDDAEPENRPEERQLTEEEVAGILHGEGYQGRKRIFITGDSGFGKSTLLLHVENRLAQDRCGLIPIRLGAGPGLLDRKHVVPLDPLSTIGWAQGRDEVLKQILDASVKRFLPADGAKDQDLIFRWFEQCVADGQVLFLLDALDQTNEDMQSLKTFLFQNGMEWSILLTGRPESLESKIPVRKLSWDHFRLRGLQLDDVREYLRDVLEAVPEAWLENWGASNHHWEPILQVPILLQLVRELAAEGRLGRLKNREAVYHATIEKLFEHGEESLDSSQVGTGQGWIPFREELSKIAWATLFRTKVNYRGETEFDVDMTGELSGPAYSELNRHYRREYGEGDLVAILKQVNFISSRALVQGSKNDSLSWRHLSFCEYFAATKLVTMTSAERKALFDRHGRHPQLGWVISFAIGIAERTQDALVLRELAESILCSGRVHTLWACIKEDRVALPESIDRLCRWLAHYDEEGRGAWDEWERPKLDPVTLEILKQLFLRKNRDSRWLHAAWELIADAQETEARAIRREFLKEFPDLVMTEVRRLQAKPLAERRASPILQLLPDEEWFRLGILTPEEYEGLPIDKRTYPRCPRVATDDLKPFAMGTPGDDDNERLHYVQLTPFAMQRGLVTNAQFELFDPSYRLLRDEYSNSDEQPVNNVSWHMAHVFSTWVDGYYAGRSAEASHPGEVPYVRLPTEAEWEYACRGGRVDTIYGVGDGQVLTEKDANFDIVKGRATATGAYAPNDWGLYDLHGNLWEWCRDWYGSSYYYTAEASQRDPTGPSARSSRVLRGGAFENDADCCRAASRVSLRPDDRGRNIGFRLVIVSGELRPSRSSA